MIVVDNNIVSGFVLPKDDFHAEAVAARKKDSDWHAPALFRSEFRSVARKNLLKGESEDLLIQAAQAAVMSVTIHELNDAEVFSIVRKTPKISSYDAEYLALAQRLDCRLVTTDEEILKLHPQLAVSLQQFIAA
jgi:predicted nucleic acid-binding protein